MTPALVLAPVPEGPDRRFTVLGPVVELGLAAQLFIPYLFFIPIQRTDDFQRLPGRCRFSRLGALKIPPRVRLMWCST